MLLDREPEILKEGELLEPASDRDSCDSLGLEEEEEEEVVEAVNVKLLLGDSKNHHKRREITNHADNQA